MYLILPETSQTHGNAPQRDAPDELGLVKHAVAVDICLLDNHIYLLYVWKPITFSLCD